MFEAVHELVLGLVPARATWTGCGSTIPTGCATLPATSSDSPTTAPDAWLVVEKILAADEALPDSWPVAGTTGYDFLDEVVGLFVDPLGRSGDDGRLHRLHRARPRRTTRWPRRAKRDTLRRVLAADVARLAEQFRRVCESRTAVPRLHPRRTAPRPRGDARWRSGCTGPTSASGRRPPSRPTRTNAAVGEALARARQLDEALDTELLEFLADVLLLRIDGDEATELALRFQQLSGPTMAKGVEDTDVLPLSPADLVERGGRRAGPVRTNPGRRSISATPRRRDGGPDA